jgi:hypothetical protein
MNQLLQGDCLEVMRELPDQSIGMVLADPKPLMKQGFTPFLRYNGKTGQCFQHPRNGDLVSVGHMKILTFKEDSLEYLTEIKRLHEVDGLSLREISSIVGRDHHWVGRRIKKAGGAIQSKKERWKGYNFTCEFCEKTFQQNWKGRGRKFCSQDCYVNFNGRTRGIMAEKTALNVVALLNLQAQIKYVALESVLSKAIKREWQGKTTPHGSMAVAKTLSIPFSAPTTGMKSSSSFTIEMAIGVNLAGVHAPANQGQKLLMKHGG